MLDATISYVPHPGDRQPIRTLAIRAEEGYLIWFLDDPAEAVWVETHWMHEHGFTAPHLKGTCANCLLPNGGTRPIMVRAYRSVGASIKHKIPYRTFDVCNMQTCLRLNPDIWTPRILDCPDRLHELALNAQRGDVALVYRRGAHKNAPFCYQMLDAKHFSSPRFDTFNVRNHMMKVWGMGQQRQEGGDNGQ